jgi:nitrile hydratase
MANESDRSTANPEQRAAALEIVLRRKGEMPQTFVSDFTDHAEEEWITDNGARMVARAWVDPRFWARMLADGGNQR